MCCMATTSQAVLIIATDGFGGITPDGVLPSTTTAPVPSTTLSVDFAVDLTGLIYTYMYRVNNPVGDTTSPNQFSVSFNAGPANVIATAGGLLSFVNPGSSVVWFFTPVAPGASGGILSFTSLFGPTWANAGANDSNPPAPWSTLIAGGSPVVAPVPEPTTVIAGALLLLPFGLSTIRFMRNSRTA